MIASPEPSGDAFSHAVVDRGAMRERRQRQVRRMRRSRLQRRIASVLPVFGALLLVGGGAAMSVRSRTATIARLAPLRVEPAIVRATLRLDGALVRGASRGWALGRAGPAHYGEPVPVQLTSYCLKGTTRRDRYVRQGIVAADPRLFPLGRYVELYVGRKYFGRFLVDDTGGKIKDAILDIWTPECRDAQRFGRVRGTAVLVPRPHGVPGDSLLTGRLGGSRER
jgi:3D (Asp-Asp-Asp) domain-containing protein